MLTKPGLYVHFPWCVRKCPYCDFNSHPLREADSFEHYSEALIRDWQAQRDTTGEAEPFASVFLGGGTPSLFPPGHMHSVLTQLPFVESAEITMEANPGASEHLAFSAYLEAGVNRLSIGAQSFNNAQLKKLGRIHQAEETHSAFLMAREGGFSNINIDLMWGLPEQRVTDALADLDAAIQLAPEHISWYQLTIEQKTEFAQRPPILPVDSTLADIERLGLERLQAAGYERYEVSAFAKSGHQCQHNLNYWAFGDYLGIGAGAHGKITEQQPLNIVRTNKAHQPRVYQEAPSQTHRNRVDPKEFTLEFMMNALRLVDGVTTGVFEERTGQRWSEIEHVWQPLVDQGLVEAHRCATTPLGLRYLDSILGRFVDAA